MLTRGAWRAISASEYKVIFDRFGGSFGVHPRVVSLLGALASRDVRYVAYEHKGEWIAAVPLWGEHVVATHLALIDYGCPHLIDIGDSEIVLPLAPCCRIELPFKADLVSPLHAEQIANLGREQDFAMTLAKGLRGERGLSTKTQARRRRERRRLLEAGGSFSPIAGFSPKEIAQTYKRLFESRWGFSPLADALLEIVLAEIGDMLFGDVLLIGGEPAAIELIYRSETPRFLLANGVNRGVDPRFRQFSPGAALMFRNMELLESEAEAKGRSLRFSFGRNDAEYKQLWAFESMAYRLAEPTRKRIWPPMFGSLMSRLRRSGPATTRRVT
ncbi:GNAT family N-acetyltransferase [Methylosinus sp. Sm6]|uniref:GNAT family N-acetyltransferase n=1 Tax=Methylosinus sp. Sm6 TaxID=2866948 RepID=UPI001C994586|nr:GNAT family N-acetyltransferase [Methylosinus sp. Sm6]MBY6241350.1 antimicrobial resistance protein Mig-14 [Methylosinus sp. Sm6]